VLLVGGEHVADSVAVFIKAVVNIEHCAARIAEKHVYALFYEGFYYYIRASELHEFALPFADKFN
jgi:adenine-specific DNA glycosylase